MTALFVVGPARPRTEHDCHNDTKVNLEAATAVIEIHKALHMATSLSQTNPLDRVPLRHSVTIHSNIYPRV
jgi:hypothetical protein